MNFVPDDPTLRVELAVGNLKQQCEDKLTECMEQLNYAFERPTIAYDLKGHTAGQAIYKTNLIRLNAELLVKHTSRIVSITLPHEFAHLASYRFYGHKGTGHGYYWQRTMLDLGLTPERTHNLPTTPARQTQKFLYRCRCGHEYWRSSIKHKRTQAGVQYTHKACGQTIRPEDFINPLDW